jgi:hypothetical protein
MLTEYKYAELPVEWAAEKIVKCCTPDNNENPGGECCYDKWTDELKKVNEKYKEKEEKAKQVSTELIYVTEIRDQFKKWFDELNKTSDLQKAVCDQLEVLLSQTEKVDINAEYTGDAVEIIFCMLRDYYIQLDIMKEKYTAVMDCIRCLNSPSLSPGTGLVKLFEELGKKLDAAIASRDDLLKKIIEAMSIARKIDLHLGCDYGLYTVVEAWTKTMNCSVDCTDTATTDDAKKSEVKQGIQPAAEDCECWPDTCSLQPMFYMPVCKDSYYNCVEKEYGKQKTKAEELAVDLLKLNKEKEGLLACKQSLDTAIKETDPKTRCK